MRQGVVACSQIDEERRCRGERHEKAFATGGGLEPISRRVVAKMGLHRGAESGSQGLTERSKKRNAGGVTRAHGD